MKVLIISDIEGVSGLLDLHDKKNCARLYTEELCVVVDTLQSIGIKDITVCDAHDSGDTLDRDVMLSKRVGVISKFWNIDMSVKYDIALLTGFHGMRGNGGFFPHTFRHDIISLKIDGLFVVGEVELFMRWLAYHGIPVVFVSGDNAAAWEAVRSDPEITVCIVKDDNAKDIISIDDAYMRIMTYVNESVLNKTSSLTYGTNNRLYIELINEDIYLNMSGGWNITGKRLIFKDYTELIQCMERLCEELNRASGIVLNQSYKFINTVRPVLCKYPQKKLMNSVVSSLLMKTPLELTKKDQNIIMSYIVNYLVPNNENN